MSFPGVKTSRDDVLVDIDRERLVEWMGHYFDPAVGHAAMREIAPGAMESSARFRAEAVRDQLRARGFLPDRVVRYAYRPFDVRWLYREPETKLLDEKRQDYFPQVFAGNLCLVSQQMPRRDWSPPQIIGALGCLDLMDRGASCFPLHLRRAGPAKLFDDGAPEIAPNLSTAAIAYLERLGAEPSDLFHHALAILHSPAYRVENGGALRQDWPRLPLPASLDALQASAALGRTLAALLDPQAVVLGVVPAATRPELRVLGAVRRVGGGDLDPGAGDLALTAGWGFAGQGGVTMAGKGRVVRRPYGPEEQAGFAAGFVGLDLTEEAGYALLGAETCDIYLNEVAYWCNVPARVWDYTLGGYQVLKKWLSYRERTLLRRPLQVEEVRQLTAIARRIAAILLLGPALDAGYLAAVAGTERSGGGDSIGAPDIDLAALRPGHPDQPCSAPQVAPGLRRHIARALGRRGDLHGEVRREGDGLGAIRDQGAATGDVKANVGYQPGLNSGECIDAIGRGDHAQAALLHHGAQCEVDVPTDRGRLFPAPRHAKQYPFHQFIAPTIVAGQGQQVLDGHRTRSGHDLRPGGQRRGRIEGVRAAHIVFQAERPTGWPTASISGSAPR